ncbi:MAG: DAK2 domain-containing protein [Coriobacteriales bacterium]|jgi:DAK2 domain fusion protein YloV
MNDKFAASIVAAYEAVSYHQEEINKLNVFPIPDGDTGTNVTLTMKNVVAELEKLPRRASKQQILRAVKQGSLMGARGNSGVITSQILRGLTEGLGEVRDITPEALALVFDRAREVAYKAVRKPVEGTILTVIKDMAIYMQRACDEGHDVEHMLRGVAVEGMESVKRTPELMPTLKENGVVDSGGLALAIMVEGFVAHYLGEDLGGSKDDSLYLIKGGTGKVAIEQINDWEDHNYRYCTEFLFKSDELDVEEAYEFLTSLGDCELVVGEHPDFKVHVHTDQPGVVLSWMIERGQPHEIFIHNMDMQSEDRIEKISADEASKEHKAIGYVAVAVGRGNVAILESLGVDKVVSGGQTINPSTADIVEAVNEINADSVIVFPGNKNIVMAANAAVDITNKPCGVVPTKNLPQTFNAILSGDPDASLEENIAVMCEAIEGVRTGEVTTAVKDAVGFEGIQIHDGDVMGILDGAIKLVGNDVYEVCVQLIDELASGEDVDVITMLAGEDLDDQDFESLQDYLDETYPDLEVTANRGEQPLYPLIASAE